MSHYDKVVHGKNITKSEKKSPYMILSNEEVLDLIRAGFRIKSRDVYVMPS